VCFFGAPVGALFQGLFSKKLSNHLEVSEIITIFAIAKPKIMANTKNYSLRERII
jgi:hypothetical protein